MHQVGVDWLVDLDPVHELLAKRHPHLTAATFEDGRALETKLLGIARVHVVCDNPFAIRAGRELYAEPKHPGWFEAGLPSLNGPAGETWTVRCKSATIGPDDTLEKDPSPLFDLTAELDGLTPVAANSAPITGYGTGQEGRLLAADGAAPVTACSRT
ncbi:hypothetical protein AB0A76_20195 [Streptomyces exfoliatus]|uniref:Uncharacterized protein n=1 Tax=Streptomyces exfoliatus TaxID=1905 RepID=A0ABV3CZ65_STREX